MRNRNILSWVTVSLAGLSLLLVLANIVLAVFNAGAQGTVAERQQFIGEQTEFRRVGELLVRSLVAASASTKDPQLAALIAKHGVSATPATDPTPGVRK
ncbi:MAG TPA: hypothetical protein VMQ63_02750 [Stellaceae bacterium]|jgi:poly(3-hydroxybutyrate) depolymerase|nr:hypothetical protein [Stellaceae bacterium]